MPTKNNKVVMILERSNTTTMDLKEDERGFILEGPFTQFGVENNNHRVYEEKEFLPHLEYLQKKINKGRLLGELDHPEKFDVSLNRASHIIESLHYDENKRQIVGRIRLLNTDSGRNAQALVKDGVNLTISSRAAGIVRENKTVQIKKVFTWDLVAEPGFDNAVLTRINESVGFDKHDNDVGIYDMDMTEDELDSKIDFIDMIYDINENDDVSKPTKENKLEEMTDNNFVTFEDFNKYTGHVKDTFKKFKNEISEKNNIISSLERKNGLFERYLDHVSNETNVMMQETETQLGETNDVLGYVEYVAKKSNTILEYTTYGIKSTDRLIEYCDKQTNEINKLEGYVTQYLAPHVDEQIQETEQLTGYNNYMAEMVDKGLQFADNLGQEIGMITEHNNSIVRGVNALTGYTENEIGKQLNKSINYQNMVTEEINKRNGDLNEGSYFGINESRNDTELLIGNSKNIGTKIDALIESVQKQKTEDNRQKAHNAYYNLLSEGKKREFLLLGSNHKQQVLHAVKQGKPLTESDFVKIWKHTLTKPTSDDYIMILENEMPEEYKEVWDSLDEMGKSRIIAQSKLSNLNSKPAIRNFWQTRSILNESIAFKPLNENDQLVEDEKNKKLGYQDNYMNTVAHSLNKMNKRK